jgi:ligand-binding sensor domain-containing protein
MTFIANDKRNPSEELWLGTQRPGKSLWRSNEDAERIDILDLSTRRYGTSVGALCRDVEIVQPLY